MEETHVTEFDSAVHGKQFFTALNAIRKDKSMNDGHLVFASDGKLVDAQLKIDQLQRRIIVSCSSLEAWDII